MKTAIPMKMPKSVVEACAKIWKQTDKDGNESMPLPPNMDSICYTYGDTCYTPRPLSKDLERHELTHTKQQGSDPDWWWIHFGNDPKFRYEQELEAYRVQYQYYKAVHGKVKGFEFAKYLANQMASPMYGNMCTETRALQDILRP